MCVWRLCAKSEAVIYECAGVYVCSSGKTFMFIVAIKTTKEKIEGKGKKLDGHFPLEFVHKTN